LQEERKPAQKFSQSVRQYTTTTRLHVQRQRAHGQYVVTVQRTRQRRAVSSSHWRHRWRHRRWRPGSAATQDWRWWSVVVIRVSSATAF